MRSVVVVLPLDLISPAVGRYAPFKNYRVDVGNDANVPRSRDFCGNILRFSLEPNCESTFGAIKG